MAEFKLNIIEFVTRLELVEPDGPTLGHRAFLKSFYGLELDDAEQVLHFHRILAEPVAKLITHCLDLIGGRDAVQPPVEIKTL
jgi:hypothetical protein